MKKNILRVIILLVTLSMLMFNVGSISFAKSDSNFIQEQANSNNEYNNILSSYRGQDGTMSYDDCYGGAFIDSNGKLNVYAANDNAADIAKIKNISGNQDLIIKKSKYSYKHLKSIMKDINKFLSSNKEKDNELWSSIGGAALLDDQNCIQVLLRNYSDEIISLFKSKINNSDAIKFQKEISPPVDQANLNAGQKVVGNTSTGYWDYSIGYRAKRLLSGGTYEYGFVTAGHDDAVGDTFMDAALNPIGTVTFRSFGGNLDVAFVKITNSNYSVTNSINGTSLSLYPASYYQPAVGSVINKTGEATGTTSGTVSTIDLSFTSNGVAFYDLSAGNYYCAGGDSGGIVYGPGSSTPFIGGIHKGLWNNSYSVFIKTVNIANNNMISY